jgi:hypothetical protein
MAFTKQDEKTVKKIVRKEIDEALKDYPTKKELFLKLKEYPNREELFRHLDLLGKAWSDKLERVLENYPTKDELFKRLDHILTAHSQTDINDRLTLVEKKLELQVSM